MKFYKSLKLIKIFNFFEVVETKDLRYLLILDDYNDLPEITEYELSELHETFEEISNEFTEKTNGNDKVLDCQFSILNFTKKKLKIENILFLLYNFRYKPEYNLDYEYLENELKGAGYNIDYSNKKEFYEKLSNISTKGLDYRINTKLQEIENLQEENEESNQTYRDVIGLFEVGLNLNIDIHKKTMVDFISYKKLYNEKIKQLNKHNKAA